jgi:hypothetical protein
MLLAPHMIARTLCHREQRTSSFAYTTLFHCRIQPLPAAVLASRSTMAANTRYQAAPQRDSFEESNNYTQAPPSYQAAGPSDGLLGAPRGEDDNVPDDFKVRSYSHPIPSHPIPSHSLSLSLTNLPKLTMSPSSADPSPKPRSTSACNSSARSTPS